MRLVIVGGGQVGTLIAGRGGRLEFYTLLVILTPAFWSK